MKINSNLTMTAMSATLLATTLISPVMAAPQNLTEMSCEEFLMLDDKNKLKIVYWVDGFSKKGLPVVAEIDIDKTDQLIPALIAECKETPNASFWEQIRNYF